jgi:hypothetical protein
MRIGIVPQTFSHNGLSPLGVYCTPFPTLIMQILYDGDLAIYPSQPVLPRTSHGSNPCLDQKPGLISENALGLHFERPR